METLDYTVQVSKPFDKTVAIILARIEKKGFRVLHVHDVRETLSGKGFVFEPMKIIEFCNARYASQVLAKDKKASLMLPCRITVFEDKGTTYVSAFRARIMTSLYPQAGLRAIAEEVDQAILSIVRGANK